MSLLDDVSIVVTPNGYKARTLFGAIPVPTFGADVITNGDFATDSGWSKGGGWSIGGGVATHNGNTNANIAQSVPLTVGTAYSVTYTVVNASAGSRIGISTNATSIQIERTTDGTYTETFTASLTSFYIRALWNDGNPVSLDNVSVKEWTGADMDVTRATAATRVDEDGLVNYAEVIGGEEIEDGDFPSGTTEWTVSGGTVSFDNGATFDIYSKIYQLDALVTGKIYKATYEITDNVGGMTLRFYNGGAYFNVDGSVGVHTVYFTALPSNTRFYINTQTGTSLVLKNISLKEVTRDNVPRIDYTGGGCPHILAEPQRTNLITNSEDFSAWTSSNSTLANSTTVVNPSGESSSGLFSVTSGTTTKFSYISVTTTSNLHSYSIFVKYSDVQFIQLAGGGNTSYANFDVQNGVLGNTNANSSIESFGNGWYRCIMTSTSSETFSNTAVVIIDTLTSGRLSSTSEVGSVYIWAAQLEIGSYPTSYIPTSGSTVTRNQDIFTRDGIGSLINSTEGVLFVEASTFENGADCRITLSDGTITNRVSIEWDILANTIKGFVGSDGNLVSPASYNQTNSNKIALKYKENDCALWINGTEVDTDFSVSALSGVNQLEFSNYGGTVPFEGKVKQLQVYDTALTDEQLTSLTS